MPTAISLLKDSLKLLHGRLYRLCLPAIVRPPARRFRGQVVSESRRAILQLLEAWRGRLHGRVLDVGVGTWTGTRQALQGVCDYTATDCFAHPNVDVISDIHTLTAAFAAESFDFLLCTDVLEHLPRPWLAVRQLHAVLKPGGTLLLTTPFNYRLHEEQHVQDYWRISAAGLRLLLEGEAGFHQVDIQAVGHPAFPFSHIAIAVK